MLGYQATASPDSYMLRLSYGIGNLPVGIGFPQGYNHSIGWTKLITQAQTDITKPNSRDADTLARWYYQFAKHTMTARPASCISCGLLRRLNMTSITGLEPLALAEGWRGALIASPDWKVVYSSDGTYLFRVTSNVVAPTQKIKKTNKMASK